MTEENNQRGIDFSKEFKEKPLESSNNQWLYNPYSSPGITKINRWLIKHSGGLIKNEKQAGYFLMTLAILLISISIILSFNALNGPKIPSKALEQPEYGLPIQD